MSEMGLKPSTSELMVGEGRIHPLVSAQGTGLCSTKIVVAGPNDVGET